MLWCGLKVGDAEEVYDKTRRIVGLPPVLTSLDNINLLLIIYSAPNQKREDRALKQEQLIP